MSDEIENAGASGEVPEAAAEPEVTAEPEVPEATAEPEAPEAAPIDDLPAPPPAPFHAENQVCPICGESAPGEANFCENCGATLGEVTAEQAQAAPRLDHHGSLPVSRPTHLLTETGAPAGRRPCAECGGTVSDDLYCNQCGTKAPSDRDHFRETPADWVAGVCDRGVRRARNEDALALVASESQGERCVLIVLDGVSSSTDSDVASLAGARAARDALRNSSGKGLGTPESRDAAVRKGISAAAAAAQAAIIAHTEQGSENPASATFTCAVLVAEPEGPVAWFGNLGDSRCYWFPDAGAPVQLTRDDSAAEALIDAGATPDQAYASPQAHAITRWLGRDAEEIEPTMGRLAITEDGWLLACSDGLWNYAREPEALADQVQAATEGAESVEDVALALIEFAKAAGGHDNITVALARVGDLPTGAGSVRDTTEESQPGDPAQQTDLAEQTPEPTEAHQNVLEDGPGPAEDAPEDLAPTTTEPAQE